MFEHVLRWAGGVKIGAPKGQFTFWKHAEELLWPGFWVWNRRPFRLFRHCRLLLLLLNLLVDTITIDKFLCAFIRIPVDSWFIIGFIIYLVLLLVPILLFYSTRYGYSTFQQQNSCAARTRTASATLSFYFMLLVVDRHLHAFSFWFLVLSYTCCVGAECGLTQPPNFPPRFSIVGRFDRLNPQQ